MERSCGKMDWCSWFVVNWYADRCTDKDFPTVGHDYVVMETLVALLAICDKNPLVIDGSPHKRPIMWSFDDFFFAELYKELNKQSSYRWFRTTCRPCHRDFTVIYILSYYRKKHNGPFVMIVTKFSEISNKYIWASVMIITWITKYAANEGLTESRC